jgi:isomerase DpgB
MVTPLEATVDGRLPLTADPIAVIGAVCDTAEDLGGGIVIVRVSGTPAPAPAVELTVGLVSRWERALRRLERLPATTIAVATGDCGGLALDTLLATDYRIAADSVRLVVPVTAGATWPGMALYRLAKQAGANSSIRVAALFGVPITASDAFDLGLLDEVTGDVASALTAATALAGSFAGPEVAIRRRLMFDATALSFEDALGRHLAACDRELRRRTAAVPT